MRSVFRFSLLSLSGLSSRAQAPSFPVMPRELSVFWNGGDALRSRLLDAVSLLLPTGEDFLATTVADGSAAAQQRGTCSAALQAEVARFVREEVTHQRAHRLYNRRLCAHAPALRLEQRIATCVDEMGRQTLPVRVALAAAIEQLTAMLAVELLRPGNVWLAKGNSPQTQLWRWHAKEEIGHHQVTVDVLDAIGVDRLTRCLAFAAAFYYLAYDVMYSTAAMCRADVKAGRLSGWRLAAQVGTLTVQALPSMARLAAGSLRYLAAMVWR